MSSTPPGIPLAFSLSFPNASHSPTFPHLRPREKSPISAPLPFFAPHLFALTRSITRCLPWLSANYLLCSVPLSLDVACEALSICQIHFLWLQIYALHPALITNCTEYLAPPGASSSCSTVQRILASHKLSRPPIDK